MNQNIHPPRIESLAVRNYRALQDVVLKPMQPLTVLLGPNGSGKSTVFDVFAFLSECFSDGLRKAWDRRGRFRELRSRGQEGSITIEVRYRERPGTPIITYHLEIGEEESGPVVLHELLRWKRGRHGKPFSFLDYSLGEGKVASGEQPEAEDKRVDKPLSGPDVLAVSTLGTLAENPRVIALRKFITDWHLSADAALRQPIPQLSGIEGPENHVYPRLLHQLAEECQQAASRTQLIVATHSPLFIASLAPEEVFLLHRGSDGYTRVQCVGDIRGIREFLDEGANLGDLWMEGHFMEGLESLLA